LQISDNSITKTDFFSLFCVGSFNLINFDLIYLLLFFALLLL
jgi:hypothetical protein